MISSVHILSSVAIATATNDWWWSIFGPVLFHYLLDLVPHWNPDPKVWPIWKYATAAILDFSVAVLVVLWLLGWRISLMVGMAMFLGILPDLVALYGFIFPSPILDAYNKWHTNIQIHTGKWYGFASQIFVIVLMIYLIDMFK